MDPRMIQQAMMARAMRQAAMERAMGRDPRMAMMQDPRMGMMMDPRMVMMQDPRMAMMQNPRMATMQDPRVATHPNPRIALLYGRRPGPLDPFAMMDGVRPGPPTRVEMMHGRGPRNPSGNGSARSITLGGRNPFVSTVGTHGGRERDGRHGKDIPVPGYELVKPLNTGGMSEAVNLIKDKRSGKLFVEKRVRIDGRARKQRAIAELHALQRVERRRNLNYMVKSMWDERRGFCSFVLEYCDGGTLSEKIARHIKRDQKFEADFVLHVLIGIAKALAFLHQGIRDIAKDRLDEAWDSIYHLDIKPHNIFFSSAGQEGPHPRVVVGDFGCAIRYSDIEFGMEHPRQQMCGTPMWYPPEGRKEMVGASRTRYGAETDIWQIGATIHAMCRLLQRPDPSIYTFNSWAASCGSRYGERLNGTVSWCCFPDWRKRPSAFKLLKEVVKIAKDKGMPQLATMRG